MIHLTSQPMTPRDIVQNVFSPLIGVICSTQAEEICHKNNLTFAEMLKPFSRLTSDAYFRDTSGAVSSVKGIRLNVCDVGWRPPQTLLARKLLTETVIASQCEKTRYIRIDDKTHLDIPVSEPWFDQWRELFLSVLYPSDHEFTRHFLSCLIVLSSSDPNALETANVLLRNVQMMQNVTPSKMPKWLTADALNCFVLLHDAAIGDITVAQQSFESLKLAFGDNKCFLLQINSHQGAPPTDIIDPWLKYLTRQPKTELPSDPASAPKTPQDFTGVTSMPATVHATSIETPPPGMIGEEVVDHPLSPTQEQGIEAIHSNFSQSCESLTSQVVNPNVWANETDVDAPHGTWLTTGDIDNLKHFIQDYTIRSLIPFVERQVVSLNEAVSNKKGVSRSLLSATKRWFVTNKPGVNTIQNAVVYTMDSTELQMRKLGDLYFMFGNYNMAFQAYHQSKRDFNADSAWQYYAGALEMAALAAFMQGTANRRTYDYMEEAIVTYLNHCKLQEFATRATLLSVECLKAARLYNEAAKQLIRMTSGDADLPSALLLEQASYMFLLPQPPHHRKYAFHIVLAGHRFSKCGQRKHAFRCYKQAYQVFENRDWSLAEDHIQYTIGKQAVTLKKLDEASSALAHLLRPSSLQSSQQQAAFLREYIATQKTFLKQSESDLLLDISLPRIVTKSIRVLVTSHPPVTSPNWVVASNFNINATLEDEWKWDKLEEIVAQVASNKPIMIFKPSRSLFTSVTPTTENPSSVQGEPIEISFALENTIKPSITFEDIHLLWEFTNENGRTFTNQNLFTSEVNAEERNMIYNIVASTFIKAIQLNEHEKKVLVVKLTPRLTGSLKINAVVGKISATKEPSSLWGKLNFERVPIKADVPSAADKPVQFDKKLELTILPPAPALHVSFTPIPAEMLAGEIIPVTVNLMNAGAETLTNIYVSSEYPRWVLGDITGQELPLSILRDYKDLTNEALSRDKESRKQHAFNLLASNDGVEQTLKPNECRTATIWLQAPLRKGQTNIKLLIYYGMPNNYPKVKHRLVRHMWNINVNESLSLEANCSIGNAATQELGLDINIKNLNQVHHPLMTEISVADLVLYCPVYDLKQNDITYLKGPGYNQIFVHNGGLRTSETIGLRCTLQEKQSTTNKPTSPVEFIRRRISHINLKEIDGLDKAIPDVRNLGSFLMKNETKYIGVLGQTGNNEEFHNMVSTYDPHMTIAISWKAIVSDNSSVQRLAYGQHFVQLRHLFDVAHCPPREKIQQTSFGEHEELLSIYNFKDKILPESGSDNTDDWGPNDISVVTRCFLEVPDKTIIESNQSTTTLVN